MVSVHIFLFTAFALQCITTDGKVQTGTIELGKGEVSHFLGKFGYGIGIGRYSVRMRGRGIQSGAQVYEHLDIPFSMFLDEDWDKIQAMSTCEERMSHAKLTNNVRLSNLGKTYVHGDQLPSHAPIAETGTWSMEATGTMRQAVRPHIWYFVTEICTPPMGITGFIDYEIHMTQDGGSEFSVEMRPMMVFNILEFLSLTFFLVWYVSRCRDFIKSAGDLHSVIWLLSLAIVLQYVGQGLHTLHIYAYGYDGKGIVSMDLCSEVFFMLSQVVLTALLIALAMGFTLLPVKASHLGIMKCIAVLSLIIHAALVSFGKLQDESACKYHENEGAVGWVLLSVRVLLFAWFLVCTQVSQQQGGLRLHGFFQCFRIAGSVYFVAYPLLFVVVQVFAPYLQHPIMQIGLFLMQIASEAWLSTLFLSRGTYFKVSALSSSILPSAGFNACLFDKTS